MQPLIASQTTESLTRESRRRVALYVLLAFAISWSVAAIARFFAGSSTPILTLTAFLFMFGPVLASLVVIPRHFSTGKYLGMAAGKGSWYLVAWLGPFLLTIVCVAVAAVFPGHQVDFTSEGILSRLARDYGMSRDTTMPPFIERNMLWIGMVQALVAGPTINAVAAFGEEAGWRGFLLRELAPLGFWRLSAITGLIWGVWHLPLVIQGHNYPLHPVAGVAMMVAFTLFLSPLVTYVRLKARSVFAAAVVHGSVNAFGGFAAVLISGGNDLTKGFTGVAGLLVLAAANLILIQRNAGREADTLLHELMQEAHVS